VDRLGRRCSHLGPCCLMPTHRGTRPPWLHVQSGPRLDVRERRLAVSRAGCLERIQRLMWGQPSRPVGVAEVRARAGVAQKNGAVTVAPQATFKIDASNSIP
jgi:hypothetical protein